MVSKWQLERRQRSGCAAAEGSAEAATSASENSGSIPRVEAFFSPPCSISSSPFFDTREISDFSPLFFCDAPPTTTLPYSLGFSAGKLPGLASKVLYLCLLQSHFCSALFRSPFAGFTAKCERECPHPHMPLPHADPLPLVGDHFDLQFCIGVPACLSFSWSPHCVSHSTTRF